MVTLLKGYYSRNKWLIVIHFILFLWFIVEGCRFCPVEKVAPSFTRIPVSSIFQNNLSLGFYILKSGFLSFGTESILTLFLNGLSIGHSIFTIYLFYGVKGLLTGLPHFFLEILAFCFFASLVIYPVYMLIRYFAKEKVRSKFILLDISLFIIHGTILLMLSALIESYLSFI